VVIIVVGFVVYFNFFQTNQIIVSGFNWLEEDVIIEVEDQSVRIESQESFKIPLETTDNILVSINTINGTNIRENRYNIQGKDILALELISSRDERQCLVEANVTDIYYNKGEDYIKELKILKDNPFQSTIYEIEDKVDIKYFAYPGNYASQFFPDEINENQKVYGVFFVECNLLENEKELLSDILGSVYYQFDL
jgi:hypothetical protein